MSIEHDILYYQCMEAGAKAEIEAHPDPAWRHWWLAVFPRDPVGSGVKMALIASFGPDKVFYCPASQDRRDEGDTRSPADLAQMMIRGVSEKFLKSRGKL